MTLRDVLCIASLALLLSILVSLRFFGKSLLSLITTSRIPFLSVFVDFLLLGLVRTFSEAVATRYLQRDIPLRELGFNNSRLLPIEDTIASLFSSLSTPLSCDKPAVEDDALLFAPLVTSVNRLCGTGNWTHQWKECYRLVQRQYEEVCERAEKAPIPSVS